jgi:hypothetical protein
MVEKEVIPEIELNIETDIIVAKTRKLKATWSLEAMQDLDSMHGMNSRFTAAHVILNELGIEMTEEYRQLFEPPTRRTIDDFWRPSKM